MTPRLFESALYAEDLAAAEFFYHDVLGLEVVTRSDLLISFRCANGVLLVFDPRASSAPNRDVPSHGRSGASHIAFAAANDAELDEWKRRLRAGGIAIEREVGWEQGGKSIYCRDPAGNSIEFAPLTLWGGGW